MTDADATTLEGAVQEHLGVEGRRYRDALRLDPAETPTVTVPQAARFLGISRGSGYEAARTGDLPTIRMGRRLLVPTARLLEMLGQTASPAA